MNYFAVVLKQIIVIFCVINLKYFYKKLLKKIEEVEIKERKRPKYTPLSKRQDRPDAILWLCKNASELTDGQISKLVGSTKGTVSLIRKRSYWNFSNLTHI